MKSLHNIVPHCFKKSNHLNMFATRKNITTHRKLICHAIVFTEFTNFLVQFTNKNLSISKRDIFQYR